MFSRSSASSMSRRRAGLSLSDHTAAPAAAAFFFAAITSSLSTCLLGASIPARRASKRLREDRLDVIHPGEAQALAQVLGHVLDVGLIADRRDDVAHSDALGGQ